MTPLTPYANRMAGISWAFFFIWIGMALVMGLGWGWMLMGSGVIVLATQVSLFLKSRHVHGVWVVCGVALIATGASMAFNLLRALTDH